MVFSEITGFGNYCSLRPETLQMQTTYEVIKVCEYSRSRSFHDDLILQDQASGERIGPMVIWLCVHLKNVARTWQVRYVVHTSHIRSTYESNVARTS